MKIAIVKAGGLGAFKAIATQHSIWNLEREIDEAAEIIRGHAKRAMNAHHRRSEMIELLKELGGG
jgi:hypothetical protein